MRTVFVTAALLIAMTAPHALAQDDTDSYVSAYDARVIAGDNGLVVLYKLQLDEGVWKIEGRDGGGQYVYMRIDPASGQVIKFERW